MRQVLRFSMALLLALVSFGPRPVALASSDFSFNWNGTPASPQAWVPGPIDDWDLLANLDDPTDDMPQIQAGHGSDCGAPPATHTISNLGEAAFLCRNHMMTALGYGYGSIFFTPAQMADWSGGPATISWKVSTERLSSRDWWKVNLTPFDQNLVLPDADNAPSYQGEPPTGLEVMVDNATCNNRAGDTFLRVFTIVGTQQHEITQYQPCVEDAVPPSFAQRSQFQIQISSNHLKVSMPGTTAVWYDGPLSVPFNRAVVQFGHLTYNPWKGENPDHSPGLPNTYHWSDIGISPALPFTMLRPDQPVSLHEGRNPVLKLAAPAPEGSFLRFAALGKFQVSFDGGQSFVPVHVQGSLDRPQHFGSFWTPVPAGTTSVIIRGQPSVYGQPWWVEDVSVWSGTLVPAPAPSVAAQPAPVPSAQPVSVASALPAVKPSRVARAVPLLTGLHGLVLTGLRGLTSSMRQAGLGAGLLIGGLIVLLAAAAVVGWRRWVAPGRRS